MESVPPSAGVVSPWSTTQSSYDGGAGLGVAVVLGAAARPPHDETRTAKVARTVLKRSLLLISMPMPFLRIALVAGEICLRRRAGRQHPDERSTAKLVQRHLELQYIVPI